MRKDTLFCLPRQRRSWTSCRMFKCCSTSGHRDREIRAWSVSTDAWRLALAGYSSASALQACCDSSSLSSPPSSMVPYRLLCASLRSSWSPVSAICQMSSTVSSASSPQHILGPMHFLSPDKQSGIECLITCGTRLLTPNNLSGTWRRICSPDIQSVSALEVLM